MYFHSRVEAGQKLAAELTHYISENCVVVALTNGSVVVGEQIALELQCKLTLLLTENIRLPGEQSTFGTVSQDGNFVYNDTLTAGEVEEYYSEFHGYLEDQKREKFQKINRLLAGDGLLDAELLKDRVVILVADGLKTGTSLKVAEQFFKPIRIKRLVIAAPIASVQAVDTMHIVADELHCLAVTPNYISANHYYDVNDVPSREDVLAKIKNNA